jgi:hypothetical protein
MKVQSFFPQENLEFDFFILMKNVDPLDLAGGSIGMKWDCHLGNHHMAMAIDVPVVHCLVSTLSVVCSMDMGEHLMPFEQT